MKRYSEPGLSSSSVRMTDDLHAKSRRRRKASREIARTEVPRLVPRNDLSPRLERVERRIDMLRIPKRQLRKCDPTHVREVTNAILALGFAVPVLITADGEVIDGWSGSRRQNRPGRKPSPVS